MFRYPGLRKLKTKLYEKNAEFAFQNESKQWYFLFDTPIDRCTFFSNKEKMGNSVKLVTYMVTYAFSHSLLIHSFEFFLPLIFLTLNNHRTIANVFWTFLSTKLTIFLLCLMFLLWEVNKIERCAYEFMVESIYWVFLETDRHPLVHASAHWYTNVTYINTSARMCVCIVN